MDTRVRVDGFRWSDVILHKDCKRIERKFTIITLLAFACGLATGISLAAAWLP